jgi:UDP-N-acetylglucosamine:LPS N-acetylglucosamine transferase
MIPQNELTPEKLIQTMAPLLNDPHKLRTCAENASKLAMPGAAAAIVDGIINS